KAFHLEITKSDEEKRLVKLKTEEIKYNELVTECNSKVDPRKIVQLKEHCIYILCCIDDIDDDRCDLIINFIEQLENINTLKIMNRLIVKTYCFGGDINPDLIRNQIQKEELMNDFLFDLDL